MNATDSFDLAIVGGGINGAGIACDAAGRGLKVIMVEMNDLASATSSASSKLIHGGLRYLEQYEFRLVREALSEREVLLRKAPHIIWPMRFVLPHVPGLRPQWMIRAGLFLYDHLYRREVIPGSQRITLKNDPAGVPLTPNLTHAFSYYDCWVDDARLVLLNAQAARDMGAEILTRTRVTSLSSDSDGWRVSLLAGNVERVVRARAVINAAGPWVDKIDGMTAASIDAKPAHVRLVKGSHIVLPRIPGTGEGAYMMQNADKRIVFVLPYEERFTIIGTTDLAYTGDPANVVINPEEEHYLLDLAQKFFKAPLRQSDIVWKYSGVRPLYDDGDANVSAVTRDYRLELHASTNGPPKLSVYGGKVTTYRCLAEDALEKLRPTLPHMGPAWTALKPLPGGDLPAADFDAFLLDLEKMYPKFNARDLRRLARRHGSRTSSVIGDAIDLAGMGRHFGEGLTEREVLYMKAHEWARSSDDVLWRRSKLGLHFLADKSEQERTDIAVAIDRLL
jgi:glycerol-3-phosphate dehydrogenase